MGDTNVIFHQVLSEPYWPKHKEKRHLAFRLVNFVQNTGIMYVVFLS